jgi:hypothetical protein
VHGLFFVAVHKFHGVYCECVRQRKEGKMLTTEQFEATKANLVTIYGPATHAAISQRTRALAKLYAESGWGVPRLAAAEGFTTHRIGELVTFGNFLLWLERNGFQVPTLSEKVFRQHWRRTKALPSTESRYAVVAESWTASLAEPQGTRHRATRQLSREILKQFSDGLWHRLTDIADAVQGDVSAVREICDRVVILGTFQTFGERRPAAPVHGSFSYRFVEGGQKRIDLIAFYAEVQPVLDELDSLVNGHSVDFSKQAVKMAVTQFRQVVDRMAR